MRTTISTSQAHIRRMTARDRFELDILCPNCGANSEARVSEDPEFRVEVYPQGFSEEQRSGYRHETKVRCECGQEFYLL
jgi:hypothetical protein